jgi:hypothetical protein
VDHEGIVVDGDLGSAYVVVLDIANVEGLGIVFVTEVLDMVYVIVVMWSGQEIAYVKFEGIE